MGPLSSYIRQVLVNSGYFFEVRSQPAGDGSRSFYFSIMNIANGIISMIVVNDENSYLLLHSISKNEFEASERFMRGINYLNLNCPIGIKYFYRQDESSISAVLQVFISDSFPNEKYINEALYHTINALKNALGELDKLKEGTWDPFL